MRLVSSRGIALFLFFYFILPLLHTQGDGYVEVPTPDILSFSSSKNDAAVTFINGTSANGVVFQHDRAFDFVASADSLVVTQHTHTI